jgi:polar amino acid transport system substrate-binding protein
MARLRAVMLGFVVLLLAACSPAASLAPTPPPATPPPATQAAVVTPEPTVDACAPANLQTVTAGKWTIGTDNPAFPPYFETNPAGNTDPWDPAWGDPTIGKGFESAMGFAIAEQLGFSDSDVVWIPIPFNNSFAPGPKDFDVFIGQVTARPERAENADLSEGYYFGNQTVVVMADSEFADATTIAELKDAELGAQVGTTSLDTIENVIKTTADAAVYNTTDDAIEDMTSGDIDGVVVDLPTAGFITSVQVDGAVIVGQIGQAAGATPEHFSLVLELDSPLTDCVNAAIAALDAAGRIDALSNEWLPFNNARELQP